MTEHVHTNAAPGAGAAGDFILFRQTFAGQEMIATGAPARTLAEQVGPGIADAAAQWPKFALAGFCAVLVLKPKLMRDIGRGFAESWRLFGR